MSDNSAIEWTGATWNPVTGCDRVSAGCDNCYAATLAKRLKAMGNPRYQRDGSPRTSGPGFAVTMHADKLKDPFGWRTPRRVFVNSMSDLFHPRVSQGFIAQVFAVMAMTPQHTYQILTKRPRRMQYILDRKSFWLRVAAMTEYLPGTFERFTLPMSNVWLGTSVEDQKTADLRIDHLLDTPAAIRFLSCEPLLGPIELGRWLGLYPLLRCSMQDLERMFAPGGERPTSSIQWLIVGAESGPNRRHFDVGWARDLRDQAEAAGVAFFYKQGSHHRPGQNRELDGRTYDEYPLLAEELAGMR